MIGLIKKHGEAYLMEGVGLAGFVIGAALITILLEHPDLPVMHSSLKYHSLLRRIPLGTFMCLYAAGINLLFGKRSGAHLNPAITWTFFKLDKINFTDTVLYTIFQFAGAVLGAVLLKYSMPALFGHPAIDFGVTKPKPPYGTVTALTSEFIISFVMMLLLLLAMTSRRFEKYTPLISGAFLGAYIIFESPLSGMSMNPARSFAGAFAANAWEHLWVYFTAPPLAMLAAGEIFQRWKLHPLVKNEDYLKLPVFPGRSIK